MTLLLWIGFFIACYLCHLWGYCAGATDKQKEMANKFSLTK